MSHFHGVMLKIHDVTMLEAKVGTPAPKLFTLADSSANSRKRLKSKIADLTK